MLFRRPVRAVSGAAPLLVLVPLLGLAGCDQIGALVSSDTETAATREAESFTQRPPAALRLDEAGVEAAFMVEAPETGLDLGWGWSIDRGQTIPTACVEFERMSDPAQETTVSIEEVRDAQELSTSMGISSSVSVKTIGFKASGKAKFAKDTKISSFSTTYVIEADVRNGAAFAGPRPQARGHLGAAVVLTDSAAALARRDLVAFQRACGEGFVSAKMTGAEAYAVIDIQTRSESSRESVTSSVSGAGWGVKVDAAFNAASNSSLESGSTSISFYQAGGSGNPLPANKDEIIARIKALAVDALDAPKTYALEITPYQVLENFPHGEKLIGDTGETDDIATAWGLYRTIYDDIGAVFAEPEKFELPVATCDESAKLPADCSVSFEVVRNAEIAGAAGASTLDLLGVLQDVALRSLDRIELGAKTCLTTETPCEFDLAALRSSYAVRAGLPMPKGWLAPEADNAGAVKRAAHTEFHLRDAVRGRCVTSSLTAGCISNAEIADWAARTGFVPLAAIDEAAFDRAVAALKGVTPFFRGDADRPQALTLWVPPAHFRTADALLSGEAVATLQK